MKQILKDFPEVRKSLRNQKIKIKDFLENGYVNVDYPQQQLIVGLGKYQGQYDYVIITINTSLDILKNY